MLLVETIPTRFCWPAENKNLSKVKLYSKGYLFWYQTFDSSDILISAEVNLILKKKKKLRLIKKIDMEDR